MAVVTVVWRLECHMRLAPPLHSDVLSGQTICFGVGIWRGGVCDLTEWDMRENAGPGHATQMHSEKEEFRDFHMARENRTSNGLEMLS